MESLGPNPSFAQMKRFGAEAVRWLQEFVHGLDRFSREPGEPWHGLADELIGRFLELEKTMKSFKGRASMPTAERRATAERLQGSVAKMRELRMRLRKDMVEACPPVDSIRAPDPATEALWQEYDRLAAKTKDQCLERSSIQRMLRRAHDPVSVMLLVLGQHDGIAPTAFFEILPALQSLIQSTPLPRQGDKTLKQLTQEGRRKTFAQGRGGQEFADRFQRFVQGVSSPDPQERKAVRKDLEKLRSLTHDERFGRLLDTRWKNHKEMLAIWDGVRDSLNHPAPVYRRAALSALPFLQFSFVMQDFADECESFILQGLQDADGMVRHKVLLFGKDFFNINRIDQPRTADSLERSAQDLLRKVRRTNPESAATIRKLLKEISWFRRYDEMHGLGDIDEDPLEIAWDKRTGP
jgi:hypothetical protein